MLKPLAAALALGAALLTAPAAQAADTLKIGWITTSTGPGAILGKHMTDGFMLAVELAGGKLGGVPTEIVVGDD